MKNKLRVEDPSTELSRNHFYLVYVQIFFLQKVPRGKKKPVCVQQEKSKLCASQFYREYFSTEAAISVSVGDH